MIIQTSLYQNLGPRAVATTEVRVFLLLNIFQPYYGAIYNKCLRVENVSTFFRLLT